MNEEWQRLHTVINYTRLSINAFATSIGLKRSENLYRIKQGKNSISKDLANIITIKYCMISKSWLLTGEGSMLIADNSNETIELPTTKKIPFYESILFNFNFQGENGLSDPLYYIDVPMFNNCDLASYFVGDSMFPDIPAGSIVALKEISANFILPGEMYLVVTEMYSTIKYIRTVANNNTQLRLVPRNTTNYDEMLLDKSLIKRLFLVKGVISAKVV